MKIFISWSGERSNRVAQLLDEWIQCVIQAVDPWLSSKDIDRGALWFSEITNQLSNTQNGIICLTKSNKDKPWILFEAGALAKGLNTNRVFTFLVDLESTEVKDPLAQFNHTFPTKESLFQLIRTINNGTDNTLKESVLESVFETYWPQFEKKFKRILKETPEERIMKKRPKEDLLNDVLSSIRAIDRRLRNIEYGSIKTIEKKSNLREAEENAYDQRLSKIFHRAAEMKNNGVPSGNIKMWLKESGVPKTFRNVILSNI